MTTNNGKAAQQQQNSQSGQSAFDEVGQIQQQADLMIQGLHQAGLVNSASAVQRHVHRFQTQVAELEKTFSVLLDPDLPVALAELKAGQVINDRLGKRQPLPYTPIPKIEIAIPGIPDFGRFYSSADGLQQQAALPSSSNSSTPSDAIESETSLPGKPNTAQSKDFATPRNDS